MPLSSLSTDLDIIQALSDTPNATDGLTASQLKAKFDQGPNSIKSYINGTLVPYINDNVMLKVTTAPTWTDATLQNGWTNYGSGFNTAGYYKDQLGIVRLKGFITGGSTISGTNLFTLPNGYRPANKQFRAVNSNNVFGSLSIEATGEVKFEAGNNTWFCVDGIQFPAEQ